MATLFVALCWANLSFAQGYINPPQWAKGVIQVQAGATVNTVVLNARTPPTDLNVTAVGAITTWNITLPNPPYDSQIITIACTGGSVGAINFLTTDGSTVQSPTTTGCVQGAVYATLEYFQSTNQWNLFGYGNGVFQRTSIDARQFGASLSSADNAAAINAAIAACGAAGGGIVYLPGSGNGSAYLVKSTIRPVEGCELLGDGRQIASPSSSPMGFNNGSLNTTIKAATPFTGPALLEVPVRTYVQYTTGTVSVVNGSPTVNCTGCNWSSILNGHFQVNGDTTQYVVSSHTSTSMTLSASYQGTTNPTAGYTADSTTVTTNSISRWQASNIVFDGNSSGGVSVSCILYDTGPPAAVSQWYMDLRHIWEHIGVQNCALDGMHVLARAVYINDLYTFNNGNDGLYFEGSDMSAYAIVAGSNGNCGIEVRNGVSSRFVGGDLYKNKNAICTNDSLFYQNVAGTSAIPTTNVTFDALAVDNSSQDGIVLGGHTTAVTFNGIVDDGGNGSSSSNTYSFLNVQTSATDVPVANFNGLSVSSQYTVTEKYLINFSGAQKLALSGLSTTNPYFLTAISNAPSQIVGSIGAQLVQTGPWTAYTPAFVNPGSGTITSLTTSGFYQQIGKTVCVRVTVNITNAGTGAGFLSIALPVNVGGSSVNSTIFGERTDTGGFLGGVFVPAASSIQNVALINGATAIATGAIIVLSGCYESV